MTIDEPYHLDENINYAELRTIVRSILISRSLEGATIQEVKQDYQKLLGEEFPPIENMTDFLLSIPKIICYTDENGTRIFNIYSSEKSQHILNMVRNQKPIKYCQTTHIRPTIEKPESELHTEKRFQSQPDNICFFEDNYQYLRAHSNHRWISKSRSSLATTNTIISSCDKSSRDSGFRENNYDAHLYDYQLLGDDFFLSIARMELKCRFSPGVRKLQSGLCVSGQTIADATKRIKTAPYLNKKIIVNIGSVDILHGHDLIDIQYDLLNLIKEFNIRGIEPIITTLAPLANCAHNPTIRFTLERFNDFIRTYNPQWKIIDLWNCMVNQNQHILFECYQNEARYVTGSNQPHVFWNKLGRQRILKLIKKNIMLI